MFSRLFKRLNRETVRKRAEYEMTLSADLKQTVTSIENIVGESSDVFKREMRLGKTISATLFFIEGLADKESIEEDVIKPLVHLSPAEAHKLQGSPNLNRSLQEVLTLSSIRVFDSFDQAILRFLGGESCDSFPYNRRTAGNGRVLIRPNSVPECRNDGTMSA
ncbi:hypothetical protein GCM10010965_29520 [Caldalkalibacillus thermarum]|uniref:spore germination protein n=1 Tax=Caldalkalibacillus thermarum TaxID=296745 RepID=UPI0019A4EEF3|nr:spore germination protein [Caldalkalibacillus thermarum]GGK34645.1 hypothetical protein GCM10010965_29520 [Caldalkalibacillus thermarum]